MYPLILIADDDPVVHESLGVYLESEGYEHQSAYDGQQALDMVESLHPDMMVLDLMMPRMSGIDVCRQIRQTSSLPIIMLTAKGEEIDRILGLELGADDYIVKPFSPREVLARIKAVLRRFSERPATRTARSFACRSWRSAWKIIRSRRPERSFPARRRKSKSCTC